MLAELYLAAALVCRDGGEPVHLAEDLLKIQRDTVGLTDPKQVEAVYPALRQYCGVTEEIAQKQTLRALVRLCSTHWPCTKENH